ncbi:MAG: 4Fe-4S dicluster domain-containing protein [Candidatus Yanofskybacteria bacterium]|nr:4Fe-4S dicluster domain-containing protein [Candidatus Yanofskybacteria bacterium]
MDRIVFIGLAVISLYLFCRTIYRRLFSRAHKSCGLPHDKIGKRLWRVILEVFLQYRVVKNRPLVGILHAAVMWGFIAFAWVSMEHLYLGVIGLKQAEPIDGLYPAFAAVWAFVVIIAIIGLSFRRFVLRPKPLGKISLTSAIVAFLILILMLTYLINWGILPVESSAWKMTWWIHTVSFFSMLVIIPRSKHLHLLLAPVAIFFRSEKTSAMRPLSENDNDDDLGMVNFSDLSLKDVLDINACVECGRCTQVCPANVSGGSLSPKKIILDLQKGLLQNGEVVAGTEETKSGKSWIADNDLFQCLSCGACESVCPTGIEHVSKILDLRRGLVSEGRVENDKITKLFTTMERSPGNPWGVSHDAREKLISAKQFPIFDGSQELLFWLGCGLSYDTHGQAVATAMKQVLDRTSISWGVLSKEYCCGEPARRAGNEYLYSQLAERLIGILEEKGVKKIISCCPHCTTILDKDYRQIASYAALDIRVTHHSEFIADMLPNLTLEQSPRKMSYHDPCYLARGLGITDSPRAILRACGISILEPKNHGQNTFCCGAGGAQLFIADDLKSKDRERINHKRFAEVKGTGASAIAVACPYCPIMLRDAANHSGCEMDILDIAEITAMHLKKEVK